jgi:hypothetical protein
MLLNISHGMQETMRTVTSNPRITDRGIDDNNPVTRGEARIKKGNWNRNPYTVAEFETTMANRIKLMRSKPA